MLHSNVKGTLIQYDYEDDGQLPMAEGIYPFPLKDLPGYLN